MKMQIKTALTLTVGVIIGAVGFVALRAQTNAPMAYWVFQSRGHLSITCIRCGFDSVARAWEGGSILIERS